MGMKNDIAIIGNGPSREIYERYGDPEQYDTVIGCNYPGVDVEFSVFADAYAAKYMRKGAKQHDRYGDFKLVLGERAANNLTSIKFVPGSPKTMLDGFVSDGMLEDIVDYPESFKDNQRYLSSGHLAFLWATSRWPYCHIHMFGFDSLFTGDHLATYSNRDVREWEDPYLARAKLDQPRDVALTWQDNWIQVFEMSKYGKVEFYGYEADPELPFESSQVSAVYIPRQV